jgi:hypothetical protein
MAELDGAGSGTSTEVAAGLGLTTASRDGAVASAEAAGGAPRPFGATAVDAGAQPRLNQTSAKKRVITERRSLLRSAQPAHTTESLRSHSLGYGSTNVSTP